MSTVGLPLKKGEKNIFKQKENYKSSSNIKKEEKIMKKVNIIIFFFFLSILNCILQSKLYNIVWCVYEYM